MQFGGGVGVISCQYNLFCCLGNKYMCSMLWLLHVLDIPFVRMNFKTNVVLRSSLTRSLHTRY